jgi:hypothetical protein
MRPLWWHLHPARLRRMYRRAGLLALTAIGAGAFYFALTSLSPWPPLLTLRHFAAFPTCNAARAVGLAPAYRGQPGYWSVHDEDDDGEACEPWVRHGRGWRKVY